KLTIRLKSKNNLYVILPKYLRNLFHNIDPSRMRARGSMMFIFFTINGCARFLIKITCQHMLVCTASKSFHIYILAWFQVFFNELEYVNNCKSVMNSMYTFQIILSLHRPLHLKTSYSIYKKSLCNNDTKISIIRKLTTGQQD